MKPRLPEVVVNVSAHFINEPAYLFVGRRLVFVIVDLAVPDQNNVMHSKIARAYI
jgi:hypothetical protein